MKKIILFPIYFWVMILTAQTAPKTIYCNAIQNVALIMPGQIQQAVTGSEHFIFSYNQTTLDSLGLLQGKPGHESNLLIRTTDGSLYSYLLKYKDTLSEFTYFIEKEARINPGKISEALKKETKKRSIKKAKAANSSVYFDKRLAYYLTASKGKRLDIRRRNRIHLEVKTLNYDRGQVYMVFGIHNRSKIDFEINNLELYKVQGKKSRRSSFQKLLLTSVYRKDQPKKVFSGDQANFSLVYPKFTLGDDEKLIVVLTETNGSRYLKLSFKL